MLTAEQIRERIAKLEAERQQLIEAANIRLAQIAGKIEAYREILEEISRDEWQDNDDEEQGDDQALSELP